MKVLHITDSHGFHEEYEHDWDSIDMIIHTGDASNHINPHINKNEFDNFLYWYNQIPVKYKIYVAGNHDTSLYKYGKNSFDWGNIIYLEDEEVTIEGIKIYGTPWCPVSGNWSFIRNHNKLQKLFDNIPENTDILCTHTPPKTVLDLANHRHILEYCGSKHLLNRVEEIKPKYHLFGHIHNNGININYGMLKRGKTTFINSTGVVDRKLILGLINQGHIFEIDG